jgi:hypothetical protein
VKQLHIGTSVDTGKQFTIPDDAVTQTFAILAIKGAGKTSTAVVMAEEMNGAGHQVVVLDPTDVWWGLRSSFDGKSAGLHVYVFGGNHPDFPLDATKGAEVADIVVETGISCVLALRHLSKAQQRAFVTDFAERLYRRKGVLQYQTPMHLFIDEADAFAPQRVMGESARCLGAIDDLVRRARSSGLGTTLISQKPATLNKDVLEMADTLIVLRIVGVPSRKAVDEWLSSFDTEGKRKEFMGSLAGLKRGEAWAWSPSWLNIYERVRIRQRHTFDSSATPKFGEKRIEPRKLASVDIDKIRERMAVVVKEAEARDPKKLQARVRDLERQLAAKPAGAAPCNHEAQMRETEQEVERQRSVAEILAKALAGVGDNLHDHAEQQSERVQAALTVFHESGNRIPLKVHVPQNVPIRREPAPRTRMSAPMSPPASNGAAPDLEGITGGAMRMLERLAERHPETWTRAQLATLAGIKKSGGTFGTYYSRLSSRGLIAERHGRVGITDICLELIGGAPPAPLTPGDLIAGWRSKLTGGARRMFDVLLDVGEAGMTREELAALAEITLTGGTFGTYLSRLMSNGLVERHGDKIFATDLLLGGPMSVGARS